MLKRLLLGALTLVFIGSVSYGARDGNGVYTLPPGYLAVTGQTITAAQHNSPLEDIETALTLSLPRNGAAPMTGDLDMGSQSIDNADDIEVEGDISVAGAVNFDGAETVASDTTTDIGAATTNYVTISGTTAITGFGTASAGVTRWGRFSGALTLTHNATSLILPGGANITTVAGDRFIAVSEGSGNWRVLDYVRTSGKSVKGATPASTTDNTLPRFDSTAGELQTSDLVVSDDEDVSGVRDLTMTRSLTMSEQAAPSTPAAGKVVVYPKSDGFVYSKDDAGSETRLGGGAIIQSVTDSTGALVTISAAAGDTIPVDDTIPQWDEGIDVVSVAITPSSASSRIRVRFRATGNGGNGSSTGVLAAAIFVDEAGDALAAAVADPNGQAVPGNISLEHEFVAGTTDEIIITAQMGVTAGFWFVNGTGAGVGSRILGGVSNTAIYVEELVP